LVVEAELILKLDGIGSAGDSLNSKNTSLSNKEPFTTERTVLVSLFTETNTKVTTAKATVEYYEESGTYSGTVLIKNVALNQPYIVKLSTPYYLTRKLPASVTFATDSTTLPTASLIAGDLNQDNTLSILDYNLLLGCFGTDEIPDSCYVDDELIGDLNDDAYVQEDDYNLFIRELNTRTGD
jgi:hypothetical protein